jgi:two-component system LytT family sensor kinase
MKRGWQIFWHVAFWTVMFSFLISVVHGNMKTSVLSLVATFGIFGVANIGLFYLNYLLLIPKFLDQKKYREYIISILLCLVVVGILKYGMRTVLAEYIITGPDKDDRMSFVQYFFSTLFTSVLFVFLSIVLQFTVDWFLNERIQRDLENQRLTAELALLKSQINPHFLFNSLNSIYSLAYQRADNTPDAILKLSEIMRYMLYECNDNKVDLAKELQYLQNYIDMQKIRFGKNAFVSYEVEGVVTNQRIVPLLLISFVENAFKHGVANDPLSPIKIKVIIEDGHLEFYMQNKKHLLNRDAAGGIGLNNVKRRLNLLYHNKHNLVINDTADMYSSELSLVL